MEYRDDLVNNTLQIKENTSKLTKMTTKIITGLSDIKSTIETKGGTVTQEGSMPTTDELVAGILSISNSSGGETNLIAPILITGIEDPTDDDVEDTESDPVQFYLNETTDRLFFLHETQSAPTHEYEWICLNGTDGSSPTINANGNWCIGDIDTGIHASVDGPAIKIVSGDRSDVMSLIAEGKILCNNIIITQENNSPSEVLLYNENGILTPISARTKFETMEDAQTWANKYNCCGLIFTIHVGSTWTPYLVEDDNTLSKVVDNSTIIEDVVRIDGGRSIFDSFDPSFIIDITSIDGGASTTIKK